MDSEHRPIYEDGYHPDSRSTDELIRTALAHFGDDEYVLFVEMLQYRGTQEVFDAAVRLSKSPVGDERILAAGILAGVGARRYAYIKESVDILISLLGDRDDDVVSVAVYALGARGYASCPDAKYVAEALPHLLPLATHSSAGVRAAVADAFGSIQWWHLSPEVYDSLVDTVIRLASDEDDDVREEAVDAMLVLDNLNQDVEAALLRAVYDEWVEVRANALLALVSRDYPGVVDLLIEELSSSEDISDTLLWAATEAADPRLLPVLHELKEDGIDGDHMELALKACSEGRMPE